MMAENAGNETFIVTAVGEGVDIRREVTIDKLAAVLSAIMSDKLPTVAASEATSSVAVAGQAKVSLREFLDETNATTKPDQVVAIGHYLSVHEGKDTFSRDDIKERFKTARERLPANFPRDFGTAINKGLIADDHTKVGQYYVTKTGVQAIDRRFSAKT